MDWNYTDTKTFIVLSYLLFGWAVIFLPTLILYGVNERSSEASFIIKHNCIVYGLGWAFLLLLTSLPFGALSLFIIIPYWMILLCKSVGKVFTLLRA